MGCEHGEWYVGDGNMICGRGCESRASDIIRDLTFRLRGAEGAVRANGETIDGLLETLEVIGVIVGVTRNSPTGERSVGVAVHALMCRARDVVVCFKKVGGMGSLYLEAPGIQAEQAILELRKLVEKGAEGS